MNPFIQSLIKFREQFDSELKDLDNIIKYVDPYSESLYDNLFHMQELKHQLDQTIGRALAFKEDVDRITYPRWVQDAILHEEARVYALLEHQEEAICIGLQKETKTSLS